MSIRTCSIERFSDVALGDIYLLPVSQYPLPESELSGTHKFITSLVEEFQTIHGRLSLEVIIRQSCIYTGLLETFVDNARRWIPRQGLAVIPHKAPPHLPTREEVERINPMEMSQRGIAGVIDAPEFLFQITDETGKRQCCNAMAGHGALSIALTKLQSEDLKRTWNGLFSGKITDRAFRRMPRYIPWFGIQSFRLATEKDLLSWFESFELYVGESKEDRGIVIASRENIGSLVEDLVKALPEPSIEPEAEILRW
jgi:hypothetical protein